MKPIYRLLRDARDLIKDPKNWIKGHYEYDGNYCMVGAVDEADTRSKETVAFEAKLLLASVITGKKAQVYSSVVRFNDNHKTTHADVMRVFNKALRKAR